MIGGEREEGLGVDRVIGGEREEGLGGAVRTSII